MSGGEVFRLSTMFCRAVTAVGVLIIGFMFSSKYSSPALAPSGSGTSRS